MGMDAYTANGMDDSDSMSSSNFLDKGVANGENVMIEPSMIMEMLTRITRLDMDLAYSSEKLVNLELYMTIVSLEGSGLGEMSLPYGDIPEVELEKALVFDLSFGYLDSEVTELGCFLNILGAKIMGAHQTIHSFGEIERVTGFQGKLHASDRSWKHLQEQLSELKRRLVDLRGTYFGQNNTYPLEGESAEKSGFDLQTARQQRLVLKMLDKSLTGQLDLEKLLLESKEIEKELNSKLSITNEVVSDLESFGEVTLEKLLEAEHSSEVFMGIAKEMIKSLQILQFNMHCSVQREGELKSKLDSTIELLKQKETALSETETSLAKLNQSSQEIENLERTVKVLEEKLQSSESELQEVNASYEITAGSLREHIFMAETRAHDAEDKLTSLIDENIELREEVAFLKGGDSSEEKISLLEKQVRDLEVQLQTARTSSVASLEQQNMLYSAIWDMETLIEELKSRVSKAETRAENAEEQCLALAEINIELNKEISRLKSDSEKLEETLKETNETKVAWIKDINKGAKLVTEMVMQLASERERIQKQLSSLARENKILLEELRKMRKICVNANQDNQEVDVKAFGNFVDDPPAVISLAVSAAEEVVETPTSTTASNQVDGPLEHSTTDEADATSSSTLEDASVIANVTNHDNDGKAKRKHILKKPYIFAAIFVLLLSILAMIVTWQDICRLYSVTHQYLGFP